MNGFMCRVIFIVLTLAWTLPMCHAQTSTQPTTTQATTSPVTTTQATTSATTQPLLAKMAAITEQDVQARISQAQMIQDEALRKKVLDRLSQALTLVQNAQTMTTRLARIKENREQAPAVIAEIRAKVSEPVPAPKICVPEGATSAQLDQQLTQASLDADSADKRKDELDALIKDMTGRRSKLPAMIAKAKEGYEETRQEYKDLMDDDIPPELMQAHIMYLRAKLRSSLDETKALTEEMLGYELRMEELRARLDLANWTSLEKHQLVQAWQDAVTQARRTEAERTVIEAREEASRALPAVKKLAEENADLAEQLSGADGLMAEMDKVTQRKTKMEKTLADLRTQFKNFQDKIDRGGVTNAISLLLRKTRSELPDVRKLKESRKLLETEQADAQFEQIQLEEQRSALTDLSSEMEAVVETLGPKADKVQKEQVKRAAMAAYQARKTYLTNLIDNYDMYIWTLADLDTSEKDIINDTTAFSAYIDEHILWFRSTSILRFNYLLQGRDAILWAVNPYKWYQVLRSLGMDTIYNSSLNGLVILIFVVLLFFKRRIRLRLVATGDLVEKNEKEPFLPTMQAVVYTALMAIVWPLILWFIGWRLEMTKSNEFIRAVAQGFHYASLILLTLEIIRQVLLTGGLAEKHFRWDLAALHAIRANLSWLIAVSLPAVFVTYMMESQNNELWKDSLGRLAFMVLLIAFSVCFWRISKPLLGRFKNPNSHAGWLKYFWYPLLVIPFVLAIIAWLGYYYTAMQLAGRMLSSLWLLLSMLVVQEIIQRWLYLMNHRLAAAKIEQLKLQKNEPEAHKPGTGEAMPSVPREPELKIYTISTQTRQLLHMFICFTLAAGLWIIWNEILPALGIFKRIELWDHVTLGNFLLAIILAVITFIAGKNLPGLLEVTILHRLPFDAGLRFAITAICRYFIIIVGLSGAFDLIGIGWAKIQWLIAAMTVGLGFGLQEIFANFVSGLIILFERPIRVGDIVTVGDVSGAVSRIHIRATTIVDWDRKEMIVPNKEFITGRVVNWTLSDRVTRLTLKVGVAYGSNTDKVQKLLLEAAESVHGILKEPSPSAIFCGFGDSSLDFELRVYISNVDNMLSLKHALYTMVNNKLVENGIEIPFPQRDLHVRTVEMPLAINLQEKKDGKI
jgi:potassium efflux system protein